MTSHIKSEALVGKYLPFEPLSKLPEGSITAGYNIMRKSIYGGWTPRKGYTLVNTTLLGADVNALFYYRNPFAGDFHILTQADGELYNKESLTAAASMGSSLISVGANKGFSCVVGENLIYCDDNQTPIIYGGNTPRCDGFIIYDGTNDLYMDSTQEVTDGSDDTFAEISAYADSKYYVGVCERASGIVLEFSDPNDVAGITATVKALRTTGWTAVSGQSDGTYDSQTHTQDGTISWTASADDLPSVLLGRHLYWYEVSFSATLTYGIDISSVNVIRAASEMTNKWDGEILSIAGALFYDQSAGTYTDCLGAVTDSSQSTYMEVSNMTTSDFIYLKTTEKALGFGFTMVYDYINQDPATLEVESWGANGWVVVPGILDTTMGGPTGVDPFARHGYIWLTKQPGSPPTPYILDEDEDAQAGYWYRISATAALSGGIRISEIVYAPLPSELLPFSGCVEFDGKLVLWGDKYYSNRLIVSPYNQPDVLARITDRYTFPFGGADPILNCLVLGDYLVVWKRESIFLTNRDFDEKITLSSRVGLASVTTAVVISSGDRTVKEDESKSIVMWQAADGVYKATEGLQITKVSDQIRNYFLPDKSQYIGDSYIDTLSAYYHKQTDTYRLILPNTTLAYSIGTSEWFPPWAYTLTPTCGIHCLGPTNEQITLIGTTEGFVVREGLVTTDKNASNETQVITHYLTTRPIFTESDGAFSLVGTLRKIWTDHLVGTGNYSLGVYLNRSTSIQNITSPTPTLAASGQAAGVQKFDLNFENVYCFQIRVYSNTSSQVMEFYSFNYQVDALRTKQ